MRGGAATSTTAPASPDQWVGPFPQQQAGHAGRAVLPALHLGCADRHDQRGAAITLEAQGGSTLDQHLDTLEMACPGWRTRGEGGRRDTQWAEGGGGRPPPG